MVFFDRIGFISLYICKIGMSPTKETNSNSFLNITQKQALGENVALDSTVARTRYLTRFARTRKVDSCHNLAYACFGTYGLGFIFFQFYKGTVQFRLSFLQKIAKSLIGFLVHFGLSSIKQ